MSRSNIITASLIIMAILLYFLSPSLSAGIFTGLVSMSLIRIFLTTSFKSGNIRIIILLLDIIKFGVIIALLFIFIRLLKLNPVLIATGYTGVFLLTVVELFIKRPKEL